MIDKKTKATIIQSLLPYQPDMIGVFGSYARGDNRDSSDLDILVSLKRKISLLRLVQIEQQLTDDLGIKVDLVTTNALKNPRLKRFIYRDLIPILDEEGRPNIS